MLPQIEQLVGAMRKVGEKYDLTPAQVALAWAIGKDTTPIIGVTKTSQIDDFAKAMNTALSTDDIIFLEGEADKTGVDTRGSWEMPMI